MNRITNYDATALCKCYLIVKHGTMGQNGQKRDFNFFDDNGEGMLNSGL